MVWFKWPQVTPQKLAACQAAAKKLATIEGVINVEFGTSSTSNQLDIPVGIDQFLLTTTNLGTNFTDRAREYNLGLFVRFTDKAALEYYTPHPVHEEFKATVAEKEGALVIGALSHLDVVNRPPKILWCIFLSLICFSVPCARDRYRPL
jgi:hypothetical protein